MALDEAQGGKLIEQGWRRPFIRLKSKTAAGERVARKSGNPGIERCGKGEIEAREISHENNIKHTDLARIERRVSRAWRAGPGGVRVATRYSCKRVRPIDTTTLHPWAYTAFHNTLG